MIRKVFPPPARHAGGLALDGARRLWDGRAGYGKFLVDFKPFLLVSCPDLAQRRRDYRMITERQFQTVLKGGIPFTIHMNDGRTFAVPDASWVTLGNNSLIVMDKDGTPHFLALPTVNTVTFDSHTR